MIFGFSNKGDDSTTSFQGHLIVKIVLCQVLSKRKPSTRLLITVDILAWYLNDNTEQEIRCESEYDNPGSLSAIRFGFLSIQAPLLGSQCSRIVSCSGAVF
jgi:hypothetical protein